MVINQEDAPSSNVLIRLEGSNVAGIEAREQVIADKVQGDESLNSLERPKRLNL